MDLLIVDDDSSVVEFLKDAAGAMGVSGIDTAASGEEALGHVIQKEYDLVTLDIRMPGVSGLEILPVLRNTCPRAVIVLLSGEIPTDLGDDTVRATDAILTKPIHLEQLSRLVETTRQIVEARKALRSLGTEPYLPELDFGDSGSR